jgi:transposase
MKNKYTVTLTDSERTLLRRLITSGKGAARRLIHARVLLKADQGLPDQTLAFEVEVGHATIERIRRRFVEDGLEAALDPRRPAKPRPHKIDGEVEAHLIAVACGAPPPGRARWSLRLLADKIVELEYLDTVSHETVRQSLKKTNWHPGASRNG